MEDRTDFPSTVSDEIHRRLDELSERLDRLEDELPPIPARALGLGRATAHRVNSTASAIANDVSRQVGRFSSTAQTALSTSAGQTRSAVERTTRTAQNTGAEATGQARTQARRTAEQAQRSSTALLDDATRAVEPADDGRPASLDDWTKAELYERAQELDVEGRSSMSKKQLIRALRNA